MTDIRIVRHYRRWDGRIACGTWSTRIDATSVLKGVTCKRCRKVCEAEGGTNA